MFGSKGEEAQGHKPLEVIFHVHMRFPGKILSQPPEGRSVDVKRWREDGWGVDSSSNATFFAVASARFLPSLSRRGSISQGKDVEGAGVP